ncbi:hypothetical protein M8J76_013441 [Diaphorina citri]|nr:hypothetical protein M8J76_013441 [Diaphorina citri]KAI5755959.1 hypothetical protein M8J77_020976 [Diaphorina citri]
MSGWLTGDYSFKCQPLDLGNHPRTMRMAAVCWWYFISKFSEFCDTMVHLCWWYYFSKFTEFFDTFFFVLRKKQNQVSTLHVIHHGVMPMSVWFGVKFTPGGHSTFFGLLNTFVHIVMYAYYFLSALGPHMNKYLWWKKYLTTLQLIQFVLIMVHAFQLLFIDCNFPKAFVWWIGSHAVMFFFLFRNFYKEQYVKPVKTAKGEAAKTNGHASAPAADQNGAVTKQNGFSKQSDYYINGDGISRPDLVQRSAAKTSQ